MRGGIFSDLKSLSVLRKVAPKNKELVDLLNVIIDGKNPASLKQVVERSVEKLELDDLFQMSESSPKIQALFESKEYENLWKSRLARLDCDLKQETSAPVFQQLMGSYLAFFYHKWVTNGYAHLGAAKDILSEVENRGVQNPFTSERAYTLLQLPTFTMAGTAA